MSKVSIDQFMTTTELVVLANLRIVDERTLRVPVKPKIEDFQKTDVILTLDPGAGKITVQVLEKLLEYAKAGREIEQRYGYEWCEIVVYDTPYNDVVRFERSLLQYQTLQEEYNSIISENEKNRQIRDEIVTKAEERLKIIMRNKEYRERYFSMPPEFKDKMLEEFI
jgi:hypothetical protein